MRFHSFRSIEASIIKKVLVRAFLRFSAFSFSRMLTNCLALLQLSLLRDSINKKNWPLKEFTVGSFDLQLTFFVSSKEKLLILQMFLKLFPKNNNFVQWIECCFARKNIGYQTHLTSSTGKKLSPETNPTGSRFQLWRPTVVLKVFWEKVNVRENLCYLQRQ